MKNEEKILQVLEQIQGDIKELKSDVSTLKSDVSTLKGDVSTLKSDVSTLKEGQIETNKHLVILDTKFDALSNKLDDIEALNASRHTEITTEIKNLSKDFTLIEAVTGKNMSDIAHLKAVK